MKENRVKKKMTSSTINLNDCVKATLKALNYQDDYIEAIDRIKNLETEVKRMKKRAWKKHF